MHLVPAGNSPKAVTAATEMFKKRKESVASAWGRGWAADGCVCLTSPGYTTAGELALGPSCNTADLWTCTEDGWEKVGKAGLFQMPILRATDLSLCLAGSITIAPVISGSFPDGGQEQQRADLGQGRSPRRLRLVSEEMQERLSPQLQLELHHLKTSSAASFTETDFLN